MFISNFVDDLLDLKQMQAGVFNLTANPFNTKEAFKDVCSIFEPQAKSQGVQVSYSFVNYLCPLNNQQDEPPTLKKRYKMPQMLNGDVRRFQQVLINLVKNALKFTPRGGSIQVKANHRNEELTVHVKDTGKGIEPHEMDRLFMRFGKLQRTM